MRAVSAGISPLRPAAARLLKRLLRRPGFKPGGRAAGAGAVAVVAMMLAIALWPEPAPPVSAPGAGAAPISTSNADQYLTDIEIENKINNFLALNAWAELAGAAAAENPQTFPETLTATPNPLCAAQYRAEAAGAKPGASRNGLMRCIAEQNARAATARPPWENMSGQEKEARSRAALRLLWEAISPETTINVRIAWQTAAEVNRHNNDEFRRFISEYAECDRIPDRLAPSMASAEPRREMASVWLKAVEEMRTCAGQVNARLFPS